MHAWLAYRIQITKKLSRLQLGSLIQSAMGESSCSAEEYVAGEDTIPVCADFDEN